MIKSKFAIDYDKENKVGMFSPPYFLVTSKQ